MTQNRDLYKESGVDVHKGDSLVAWLQDSDKADQTKGQVVAGIGGFAALYKPDFKGMSEPLLVSGTDGVGTKVLLGLEHNQLEGLGIDLVAMCVNDLYTVGAEPLFFLDYFATGKLDESQFKAILTGIKRGLASCQAVLLGGETAELPGLYAKGHFDLAGFVVGVVDGPRRLGPELVEVGDSLYAFESSGFHSNGYSLVRKWLNEKPSDQATLDKILTPTRIYSEIPKLLKELPWGTIHAIAHITGGGISGNLPRVLPENTVAELNREAIPTPAWMKNFYTSHGANFANTEAVFNQGIGMIAAVSSRQTKDFEKLCQIHSINVHKIGAVAKGTGKASVRYAGGDHDAS